MAQNYPAAKGPPNFVNRTHAVNIIGVITCACPHALLNIPSFFFALELKIFIIKHVTHVKVAKGMEIIKIRAK
jgi:hypothetical protein